MAVSWAKIGTAAASAIRRAYQQDRRNRYALKSDWTLPVMRIAVPAPFDGPLVRVEPLPDGHSRWTIKAYSGDTCDGASLAPDSPKGVLEGALAHDPLYLSIDAMAETWNVPRDDVRGMADRILSTIILRSGGRRFVARLYYNGVYYLGGIYRTVKRAVTVAVIGTAIFSMVGWSGCIAPPDDSDPASPYTPPTWEKTR